MRSEHRHRPIATAARRWGFSDPTHFTRRFRAACAVTPGEWRRIGAERSATASDSYGCLIDFASSGWRGGRLWRLVGWTRRRPRWPRWWRTARRSRPESWSTGCGSWCGCGRWWTRHWPSSLPASTGRVRATTGRPPPGRGWRRGWGSAARPVTSCWSPGGWAGCRRPARLSRPARSRWSTRPRSPGWPVRSGRSSWPTTSRCCWSWPGRCRRGSCGLPVRTCGSCWTRTPGRRRPAAPPPVPGRRPHG